MKPKYSSTQIVWNSWLVAKHTPHEPGEPHEPEVPQVGCDSGSTAMRQSRSSQ